MRDIVITGTLGGLCMLTRLENIIIVFLILCVDSAFRFSKEKLRLNGIVLAVSLFLTMPYLGYQYYKFKSPVYSTKIAARFWMNTETKGPESTKKFEGGPMDISAFIFRHGVVKTLAGISEGYVKSFLKYIPKLLYYKFLILFLIAGLFFCIKRKEYFLLLLLPVLILPVGFIAGIDQVGRGSGIELRFYMNALWLVCVYCGIGAQDLLDALITAIFRRHAS